MLIVLSGLPGSGKSTLAQALGRALRLPVLSVDPIEAALLQAGLKQSFETGLSAYLVAEALADSQLSLGQGAIVDAVNAVEPAKEMWRRLAARHSVPLRIIESHCSDEALHRLRLESRQRGLPGGFPEPGWADVVRRRAESTAWAEPHLTLDSALSLEHNLALALAWLEQPLG